MATTLENALRLVKPGEMVVSVTEIFNQIGSKLTADEKEKLLIAMLSPRREKVQPGDLITSDLVNQILSDIADLRIWIARVEAAQSTGKRIRITQIISANTPPRVRDILEVRGENFESPPQKNKVTISGVEAFQFSGASDEGRLVFEIPNVVVPAEGKIVPLRIENTYGSDSVDIKLLAAITFPKGNLKMGYVAPPVLDDGKKIEGNVTYYFRFSVLADTDLEGEYALKAEIDPGWDAQIVELNSDTAKTRIKIPGMDKQPREFRVKVKVADLAAGSTTLKVSATDISGGNLVTPDTKAIVITIAADPPVPDSRLSVWVRSLVANVELKDGRLVFKRDQSGTVQFYALGQSGITYELTARVKDGALWEVQEPFPDGKATMKFGSPAAKKSVNVTLLPKAGAQNDELLLEVVQTVPADPVPMQFYVSIG